MIGMQDLKTHSPLEQFAMPHQFAPRLTIYGAIVAVAGALARIFLGSLVGALWGVQIWLAVVSDHSLLWKIFAIFGLAAALTVSLAVLMWAIEKATMKLSPCATSSSVPPVI